MKKVSLFFLLLPLWGCHSPPEGNISGKYVDRNGAKFEEMDINNDGTAEYKASDEIGSVKYRWTLDKGGNRECLGIDFQEIKGERQFHSCVERGFGGKLIIGNPRSPDDYYTRSN